jgi:hypothetical protein
MFQPLKVFSYGGDVQSWWPDYVAFVDAEAASLAVVQLMRTYSLQSVSKAAVTAPDGTRHR